MFSTPVPAPFQPLWQSRPEEFCKLPPVGSLAVLLVWGGGTEETHAPLAENQWTSRSLPLGVGGLAAIARKGLSSLPVVDSVEDYPGSSVPPVAAGGLKVDGVFGNIPSLEQSVAVVSSR